MIKFIDKILIPFIDSIKENLPIERCDQIALAISDVFKAHWSAALLDKLKTYNIKVVFVPPACTDQNLLIQPLDAIPNKVFKDELKYVFQNCYSDCVADKAKTNGTIHDIDLRPSANKPVHARLLMKAHDALSSKPEMIKSTFEKCGI